MNTLILRIVVAFILLMHSIPGMLNGGVIAFGKQYLDSVGFSPFGIYLAWAIKISHILAALCFLANRYLKPAGWASIFIFAIGIWMVHMPEGWFVVGGGRNGVEFNVLLIAVVISIMYPKGFVSNT